MSSFKKDWIITIAKLRNFLNSIYAWGTYEARSLEASKRLHKFIYINSRCYPKYGTDL